MLSIFNFNLLNFYTILNLHLYYFSNIIINNSIYKPQYSTFNLGLAITSINIRKNYNF